MRIFGSVYPVGNWVSRCWDSRVLFGGFLGDFGVTWGVQASCWTSCSV